MQEAVILTLLAAIILIAYWRVSQERPEDRVARRKMELKEKIAILEGEAEELLRHRKMDPVSTIQLGKAKGELRFLEQHYPDTPKGDSHVHRA